MRTLTLMHRIGRDVDTILMDGDIYIPSNNTFYILSKYIVTSETPRGMEDGDKRMRKMRELLSFRGRDPVLRNHPDLDRYAQELVILCQLHKDGKGMTDARPPRCPKCGHELKPTATGGGATCNTEFWCWGCVKSYREIKGKEGDTVS